MCVQFCVPAGVGTAGSSMPGVPLQLRSTASQVSSAGPTSPVHALHAPAIHVCEPALQGPTPSSACALHARDSFGWHAPVATPESVVGALVSAAPASSVGSSIWMDSTPRIGPH